MSASLPAVFAAVTVVVLVSLFPAMVEAQGDPEEPCPGGGFNPTPTAVTVTTVPIVVASITDEYFVLYVTFDVDGTELELPVLVKKGAAGTTTLAENVEALPADHYQVEKYLVTDPADVDGDCIDDLTELSDPVVMNPVNAASPASSPPCPRRRSRTRICGPCRTASPTPSSATCSTPPV